MILKRLYILNFKNIADKEFSFSEKINCFVGNNGIGKTNSLDAIYHLGMTKSYFNTTTSYNIRLGEEFYLLEGTFLEENREENVVCSVKKGQKKVIKRNGKIYDKLSEHIGAFPVVIVSPADRDLIHEGSDTRRKFLDGMLSQVQSSAYLDALLRYNKVLSQRNSLLKQFYENQHTITDTLPIYDDQLDHYGTKIFQIRKDFIREFVPIFQEQYAHISKGKEKVDIQYDSQLNNQDLKTLLKSHFSQDISIQYTSQGIHKDDLIFSINGQPMKKFASQGQQKSFLIALKLAQFHYLYKATEVTPLLLLDDIFDKLDNERVSQIIHLVISPPFGQIFLSDTDSKRTEEIIREITPNYQIFKL